MASMISAERLYTTWGSLGKCERHEFVMVKMQDFLLYSAIVFAVLTPPKWVCRESEP